MTTPTARAALVATLLAPAAALPAQTGSAVNAATTITIVRVPTPWYAPNWLVTRRMRGTQTQYAGIDGLLFKAYAHASDRHFGGVYLWASAEQAYRWFNADWHARVLAQYGKADDVRYFSINHADATLPMLANPNSDAVAMLMLGNGSVGKQDGSNSGRPSSLFASYDVKTADGSAAVLTFWRSRADADRDARTYAARLGVPTAASWEWFSLPILLPTQQARNATTR
ncbi:MAG: hypothetical protein HEQ38_07720 [Gemmatimonas sp.]|nr:hypothetical protein [Gemmatimonas sp.]